MKLIKLAAMLSAVLSCAVLSCNVAVAQVSGMVAPTPTVGTTSPLGSASASSSLVSPTGIPLGSTEITSTGVSPLPPNPTGTIATPGTGTPCTTLGTSSSQMFGSSSTYDGGGLSIATSAPATASSAGDVAMSSTSAVPATSGMSMTSGMTQSTAAMSASGAIDTAGMSAMCGSGSNSMTASSTPTSPTTTGGMPRAGIPLGSIEIGSLGVSSVAAVPGPTITAAPTPGFAMPIPTTPAVTSLPAISSTTTP